MLLRKWWMTAFAFVFIFSSVLMVGATGERFTLKTNESYASTKLLIADSDVLIWNVKNTSKTEELHFAVRGRGFEGWCGTLIPNVSASVKPGETLTGSKLGTELDENTVVTLSGDGEVELQVK